MHYSLKIYLKRVFCFLVLYLAGFTGLTSNPSSSSDDSSSDLQFGTFDIDVTPPVGFEIGPVPDIRKAWDLGIRARGIVLSGSEGPVILLAIDWCNISMKYHDAFQRSFADAAGTFPQHVAVYTVHQHDAPRIEPGRVSVQSEAQREYVDHVITRLDSAVRYALRHTQPVTHIGLGKAKVHKVASSRRLLSSSRDNLRAMRFTSYGDSAMRAEPEGVIDPIVSLVSFWNTDKPLAVLSYYATHSQSYYHTGIANPDFSGVARFLRQLSLPNALHVHFTGAGGNIGAGKYNDGSHENRGILARRLAEGMKRAWKSTERQPISASSVAWNVKPVSLPADNSQDNPYVEWYQSGGKIDLQCLTVGPARILHMPGELFVEYQLAAKAMRPELFVAVAAYGDDGPHYIPTAVAFPRGGYEVGASRVTPEAEDILMVAMRELLNAQL